MYSRITCMMAISFFSPLSTSVSTSFLNCLSVSAIIAFNTVMALAQWADEPTALYLPTLSDIEQERDYFMQRYHDIISSFGGKTSYDADNRPLLVMRSNLWASGYDVDGTDQTSLGQFSGRVQQTYK